MGIFRDVKSVFFSPGQLFEEQIQKQDVMRGVKVAVFVVVASVILGQLFTDVPMAYALVIDLSSSIKAMVGVVLLATIMEKISAKLGGQGELKALVACTLSASGLMLLYLPIVFLLNSLEYLPESDGLLFGFALLLELFCVGVWFLYLCVMIIKKCCKLSNKKSIVTLVLSLTVVFVFDFFIEGFGKNVMVLTK